MWLWILLTILAVGVAGAFAPAVDRRLSDRDRTVLFWVIVLAVTAVGAAFRCVDLTAPLCDSGQSTRVQLGASSLWSLMSFDVFDHRHPPAALVLLHLGHLMGGEEWMLRLPFVVVTVGTLPVVALVGRRIGGPLVGLGALVVCALSEPMAVMAREMKSHALFPLAVMLVILALIRARERPSTSRILLLGIANAATAWMHYMAPIVVVVQLVGLLSREHRRWVSRSLLVSVLAAAPPLYRLSINLARDMELRSLSSRYPDVTWGANTVGDVASSGVHIVGPALLVLLLVLGVAGAARVLSRRHSKSRLVGAVLVFCTLILPVSVLTLTPLARMLGVYLRLSIPMLAVMGSVGAVHLGQIISRVAPMRRMSTFRSVATWALALAPGVVVSWQLAGGYPRDVYGFDRQCDYPAIARDIMDSDVDEVVLVHGYSTSLLGFYFTRSREISTITGSSGWRYGPYTVWGLADLKDIDDGWKQEAVRRLGRMAGSRRVWLLDLPTVEGSWPELEQAGGCTLHREYPNARLLLCGR